ncbi:MAG: 4Fe-4S dicluster domain-containing protein [Thermodesulfobacteriota bacterium]
MRIVNELAVVDERKCSGCGICVRICPVEAIRLKKYGKKRLAVIDASACLDCKLCLTRCPEYAIGMTGRDTPLQVGVDMTGISEVEVAEICESAHMYPNQVVCYCHRVLAGELAAAIIRGARTPEDLSRATGARTGCGTLCITGMIRLLKAAGIELADAPGDQWYGLKLSIWDIPPEVRRKYPQYFVDEDLKAVEAVFPKGKQ